MTRTVTRWLFADQLGPHFLDDHDGPVLLIESRNTLRRRRYHRAKAHLVLSALRHRAAELQGRVTFVQADTYAEGLACAHGPIEVIDPTSRAARAFVRQQPGVRVLEERGFATGPREFQDWLAGRGSRRLLQEDLYRDTRRRTGLLMDGDEPMGGRWNFDHENREPPPRGVTTLGLSGALRPPETEIDEQVRADLDRWASAGSMSFVGNDGPRRFAVTHAEATRGLSHFIDHRLSTFGPHEDAVLEGDPTMSHSLLSVPMNLGLLDPLEVARAAERALRNGRADIASVEGFVRQVVGWRDWVWHLYWQLGPDYFRSNALDAREPLPQWWSELDADALGARCLGSALREVRDTGWTHHIVRLMVLGNWALERGYDPVATVDWFQRCFVDGYEWVMAANVIGMALYADGGKVTTKPYAAGGSYINRMSDHCRNCCYRPTNRVGELACPFTAGYWWFLARNADRLRGNHRLSQPLAGLQRLADLDEVLAAEEHRGTP